MLDKLTLEIPLNLQNILAETAARIELFSCVRDSVDLSYAVLRKLGYLQK